MTVELVAGLLRQQAPHLAGFDLRPSHAQGSSNWVFRLGADMAVRLPRSGQYTQALETEVTWLPVLGRALTTPVPHVLYAGHPSPDFPFPWSVVSWIHGERPGVLGANEQQALAQGLARFVTELHAVGTGDVPAGPEHWGYRCGEPVTEETDAWAEVAARGLADTFNPAAVREAWRLIRDVPVASATRCWVHTDLSAENLLVHPDGRLAGVIDFGAMGVGDPAVDLLYAWSLFDEPARGTLREVAGANDALWSRARAFAFVGPGLLTLLDYRDSMPERAARLTKMVCAIASEVGVDLSRR